MFKRIIYVEGNIGSGKSTFVDILSKYINKLEIASDKKIKPILIQEPVDEWMTTYDSDGKNILQKFYEDSERWSFTFQMNSFISRAHKIQEEYEKSIQNNETPLLIVERSIYTDRYCFAKNCYESGKMTKLEYDIYCRWNDWLSQKFDLRPSGYIYLRCSPEENVIRIEKRLREGESGIPLEYLQQLHRCHDEWMGTEKKTIPVMTIDSTKNFFDTTVMNQIYDEVEDFVLSV